MPTTGPQDGIVYTLEHADGSTAVFNNPSDPNYVGMARWTGLDDSDVREVTDDRTERDGGVHGNFWKGRRPIVGTIEIAADSATDRNEKAQLMRRASNALREDSTLTFTPDGGVEQFVRVRKNGPMRRADQAGWLTQYSLPLVSADPFIYSTTLDDETDTGPTASVVCSNDGDAETYPIIRIDGPAASPTIANTTTGQTMTVRQAIETGNYADIDMAARTVILNDETNIYASVAVDASSGDLVNTSASTADTAANVDWPGNYSWGSPTNAQGAINAVYATASGTSGAGALTWSDFLNARDFDFAVPSTATISGVVVTIRKAASALGNFQIFDSNVTLTSSSTSLGGSNRAAGGYWPAGPYTQTYGGQFDLWGLTTSTLTPTVVNDAQFGVWINVGSVGTAVGHVDSVSMTVYYTTSPIPAPDWFSLQPGNNTITCDQGDLTVTWRDAWL